jgi:hypothetical protein
MISPNSPYASSLPILKKFSNVWALRMKRWFLQKSRHAKAFPPPEAAIRARKVVTSQKEHFHSLRQLIHKVFQSHGSHQLSVKARDTTRGEGSPSILKTAYDRRRFESNGSSARSPTKCRDHCRNDDTFQRNFPACFFVHRSCIATAELRTRLPVRVRFHMGHGCHGFKFQMRLRALG